MNKCFTIAISGMFLFAVATQVSATVWRVNGTPNSTAHYSTLQAAHDAVTTLNGDTLYLEGSLFSTGGLSCTKQLTIIGSGYFLNQNPETQFNKSPSIIDGYLYFYDGSGGSKIMGSTIQYSIYIYTGNISIERNLIPAYNGIHQYASNTDNVRIIGNYFDLYYGYSSISFPYQASNLIISNNYIGGSVSMNVGTSGIFMNNIFGTSVTIYNSNVINNISISPYYDASLINCITTNNIGNGTQFAAGNGNQQNVVPTDLFVGLAGNSTDGQWQLKPGSPAIGTGEGGVDCGIYGGAYPYVLSGMPPIPAIYDFDSPSLPNGNMNVSIKAKAHN